MSAFKRNTSTLPIAVFDSGLGGLTVLKALASALPEENFVYLGDTARLPYGSKSAETIAKYVEQNCRFLLNHKMKALVVACNSASSVLDDVTLPHPVPIFGVIEPGAREALSASTGGRIGVIGTQATVARGSYPIQIHKLSPAAKVFQAAASLLVPLVEEGWLDDPLTSLVVNRYVSPLVGQGIDTLILGCTHYPALKAVFRKVVGPNIALIDSAEAMAHLVTAEILAGRIPAAPPGQIQSLSFLTTDLSPRFGEIASSLMAPFLVSAPTLVDL